MTDVQSQDDAYTDALKRARQKLGSAATPVVPPKTDPARESPVAAVPKVVQVPDPLESATKYEAALQLAKQRAKDGNVIKPAFLDKNVNKYLSVEANGAKPLGEAGFPDTLKRAHIGLADTFEEKQATFRKYFPDGDFIRVTIPRDMPSEEAGSNIILYRRDKKEPYSRYDELYISAGDIADVSSAGPQIAGEIIGGVLSRGAKLLTQAVRIGFGSTAGELANQGIQSTIGVQQEPITSILTRAGLTGLTSTAAAILTAPLSGTYNVIRGAGVTELKPGAARAMLAQEAFDLPPLLPWQTANSPLLERLGGQATQLSADVVSRMWNQQQKALMTLEKLGDKSLVQQVMPEIKKFAEKSKQELIDIVQSVPVDKETAGVAIQKGLIEWDAAARMDINNRYALARSIEAPEFSIEDAKDIVKTIRVQQEARAIGPLSAEMEQLLTDIDKLPKVIGDFNKDGINVTSIERINALASRAFDLKEPGIGQMRHTNENRLAGHIFDRLRNAHDNPLNPGSDEFKKAWSDARGAAKERFDTLEAVNAITTSTNREFAPYSLAESLLKPGRSDAIRLVRETLNSKGLGHRWDQLREAFKSDLLDIARERGGDAMMRHVRKFDTPTLSRLLSVKELTELKSLADEFGKLDSLGISESITKSSNYVETILRIGKSGDHKAMQWLVGRARSDKNLGESIRAGMLDYLAGLKKTTSQGPEVLDRAEIERTMNMWRLSGAIDLLEPGDMVLINGLDHYLRFARPMTDTGASLAGAETASQIRGMASKMLQGSLDLSPIHKLLETVGFGRFAMSPMGRRFFTGFTAGSAKKASPIVLRLAASIAKDVGVAMTRERQPNKGAR